MNCIDYIISNNYVNENENENKYKYKYNSNPNNKFLSQIKTNNFFFQNELLIHKIINPDDKRFYIFQTVEMIDYNEINKNIPSLEYSTTLKHSDNYLTRYKDIQFLSFEDVLSLHSNNIQSLRFLINSYKFLLDSIYFLVQNNIIHNNISTTSIGINDNNEPVIFKFDLSLVLTHSNLNINYLSKYFLSYDPTYYYRPLELHLFSYLLSNKLTSLSMFHTEKIIEEVITNNMFICNFGENIKSLYEKEGRKFLEMFINKPFDYIVKQIFKYHSTWDNYRLSILYLQLIINTYHLSENFIKKIIKILLVNIHSNPNLRYSIQKTKDILEEVCYNTRCDEYKKIKLITI